MTTTTATTTNARRAATLLFTVALTVAAAMPASANDRDVRATPVPAALCHPASHLQAAKVMLSNAAWVFRSGQTGSVDLYCPVTFNAFTESDTSNDNDISSLRIYYRDTDGGSNNARVMVRLLYRQSNGLYGVGSWWSSNAVGGSTGNRIAYRPLNHDVRGAALYTFLVRIARTNTSESPAFSGIDFENPPVQ